MKPLDLTTSARVLVDSCSGKPSQVSLRRAVSSTYYAVFHCLARNCADMLIGGSGAERSKPAWRQAYRALDHGFAKTACKDQKMLRQFPKEIEDFAENFVALQEKRHSADYDPHAAFAKSTVLADIAIAEVAIRNFQKVSIKDRRAFAAHVLFRKRPTL